MENSTLSDDLILLLGAGGHAKVAASAALRAGLAIAGVFDDAVGANAADCLLGLPVRGPIPLDEPGLAAHVAIGSNQARCTTVKARPDWRWRAIIHPWSCFDDHSTLGLGSLVCAGAVVQANTMIGAHAIINTAASLDHDCRVGDFAHIAPRAALAGGVTVGTGAFIGIGACVVPGISIGAWAVVGAGAIVIRDVAPEEKVAGNPARPLQSQG